MTKPERPKVTVSDLFAKPMVSQSSKINKFSAILSNAGKKDSNPLLGRFTMYSGDWEWDTYSFPSRSNPDYCEFVKFFSSLQDEEQGSFPCFNCGVSCARILFPKKKKSGTEWCCLVCSEATDLVERGIRFE